MKYVILFIASGMGAGYIALVRGTAGSVVGLFCYLILSRMGIFLYLLSVLAIIFIAIWSADRAEKIYGVRDDQRIVIDEMSGMLVSLASFPYEFRTLITGFILFRFFDIVKVYPANVAQRRLNGGTGVVMDDVIAGIYANICLHILRVLS